MKRWYKTRSQTVCWRKLCNLLIGVEKCQFNVQRLDRVVALHGWALVCVCVHVCPVALEMPVGGEFPFQNRPGNELWNPNISASWQISLRWLIGADRQQTPTHIQYFSMVTLSCAAAQIFVLVAILRSQTISPTTPALELRPHRKSAMCPEEAESTIITIKDYDRWWPSMSHNWVSMLEKGTNCTVFCASRMRYSPADIEKIIIEKLNMKTR